MGETPQRSAVWILLGGLVGFAALVLWSLYHFVLGPGLMSNVVRQRQAAAQTQILELSKALEAWSASHLGEYPRSLEALGGTAAREPDPWGHPWSYAPPGRGELRPTLRSLGRDGLPGGTGEDADVDREGVLRAAR
ncbi:MAG TPA: type II secretion system protein GspG [Myxococcota bacterium]|nr:type II secretion system protein GspG [Myxococcota bacterium]